MGAEMTKWMIDSKVEDLHKKMPWRDDDDEGERGQQQAADSVVDNLGQMFGRTEEESDQERKETEAALKKSRKVAASLRSKYKLGSDERQTKTEDQKKEEKKRTQEQLDKSRSMREKMRTKYQRG